MPDLIKQSPKGRKLYDIMEASFFLKIHILQSNRVLRQVSEILPSISEALEVKCPFRAAQKFDCFSAS